MCDFFCNLSTVKKERDDFEKEIEKIKKENESAKSDLEKIDCGCLLYTSPSPRD